MDKFMSGKYELDYKLDRVSGSGKTVIYIPGTKMELTKLDWLANSFVEAGYNFVRFKFKYQQSGKKIDFYNVKSDLDDLKYLFSHLSSQGVNLKNCGIISKSFGGLKAFLLEKYNFRCFGFIAPVVYFSESPNIDVMKNVKYRDIKKFQDLQLDVSLLKRRKSPTIFIHGKRDNIADINNTEFIYQNLNSEKRFSEIEEMTHSIDEEKIKHTVSCYLLDFFNNNI